MTSRDGMRNALRSLLGATDTQVFVRRKAIVLKSTRTSHDLAMSIRERDDEIREHGPITERTPFGLWQYGQGGTSSTTYDTPPVIVRSKQKYRSAK